MDAAYTLPSPLQIIQKLWELRVLPLYHPPARHHDGNRTRLWRSPWRSVWLLAVAMDASGLVRRVLYPLVVVSQTIPTTAIAPLFVLWFGYGIWSKVLVTVLITFSPSPSRCMSARAPSLDDLYVDLAAG
ncbi:MAG: ABC transporter permease [Oscillospiraceae bacterium]